MCLGKYLRKSKEKLKSEELIKEELRQGIQIIKYQLNTLMAIHGQLSCVILYLHLEDNDEYKNENIMIIKELLSQYMQGIKNVDEEYEFQDYLKFVYITNDNYKDINEYVKSLKAEGCPIVIKEKSDCLQQGKFSQGKVSINLEKNCNVFRKQ